MTRARTSPLDFSNSSTGKVFIYLNLDALNFQDRDRKNPTSSETLTPILSQKGIHDAFSKGSHDAFSTFSRGWSMPSQWRVIRPPIETKNWQYLRKRLKIYLGWRDQLLQGLKSGLLWIWPSSCPSPLLSIFSISCPAHMRVQCDNLGTHLTRIRLTEKYTFQNYAWAINPEGKTPN